MTDLAIYSAIGGAIGAGFFAGGKFAYDFFKNKSNGNGHKKPVDATMVPGQQCQAHSSLSNKLDDIVETSHQINKSIITITTEFRLFKEEVYKYYAQKNG